VGTALSLIALAGSLALQRTDDVAEVRRLAGTIRDTAREALAELRGVISGLPQVPTTIRAIASGLAAAAGRAAGWGASIDVQVAQGETAVVAGEIGTAVVRIFHEAVHNALRHGRARAIPTSLAAIGGRLHLTVARPLRDRWRGRGGCRGGRSRR
jgi:signal transduction histidine kinase